MIKMPEDVHIVSEKIICQLVNRKLAYFSLLVDEDYCVSSCFVTPVTQVSKGKSMIMVEDYETILKLLLSHPYVSQIEYDEERNVIYAIFKSPYPIKEED